MEARAKHLRKNETNHTKSKMFGEMLGPSSVIQKYPFYITVNI